MKSFLLAALTAGLLSTPVTAQDWTLDTAASTVEARLTVFNAPVIAAFDQFDADIQFDPEALENASISATVFAASGTVTNAEGEGVSDYQNAMEGTSGLDVNRYEAVRFESSSVSATDEGYEAAGTLSVRDVTRDVVLRFTLEIEGDRAVAQGGFSLSRADLGLANSSWGNNVSDAIEIVLQIEADRASGTQ